VHNPYSRRPHTTQPQPCRPVQTTHVGEIMTALELSAFLWYQCTVWQVENDRNLIHASAAGGLVSQYSRMWLPASHCFEWDNLEISNALFPAPILLVPLYNCTFNDMLSCYCLITSVSTDIQVLSALWPVFLKLCLLVHVCCCLQLPVCFFQRH